jgi:hypothetical protein
MKETTMKRCLISLALILATVCTMAGQQAPVDAPSREDILKLFDVMHVREQMKQVIVQVMKQIRVMTREQIKKSDPDATDEQIAKVDAMSDQLFKDMPVDGMLDDMIPVYRKHLTRQDVDAMVAFHSTPTGQKILSEMPAMTAEGMQAVQPRLRKVMDETTEKMGKMASDAGKKQKAEPAPDAPKQ